MRDKSLQIVSLSKRLESIVELAGHGDTLCDVGCDHAHVPIRLLQNGQYRKAIGMDVIEGPLGKARGNLELYGMTDDVELRLSDGLDAFQEGEADTLVVTGMGGTLMRGILLREPDKTRSFNALVLGPQSDPDKVRAAVRELGFSLEDERLIYEDGKYYPVLLKSGKPPLKGVWNSDAIELVSHAILIEEEFDGDVYVGFVDYEKIGDRRPVVMDVELRKTYFDIIHEVKEIIDNKKMPKIKKEYKKCEKCEYKDMCKNN